jgi:hypothetical protein
VGRKTTGDVMKKIFVSIMLMLSAVPAQAQIGRRRVPALPEPSWWLSGSVGLFNANTVNDGETSSRWNFGQSSSPRFRASIEKSVSTNASVGLTGTFAHVPFIYEVTGNVPDNSEPIPSCARCDAHLNIVSLGGSFHYGGGIGLHQVIEASAGVLQYRDMKSDREHEVLPPSGGNIDPYFTFGYGFGYSINPNMQISVGQDLGLGLHESRGLSSEDSNTLRERTLRVNFRYGFASRVRKRIR